MTTRAIILFSTLLFSVPLFAREKSDVIVMKNGDRFTCEIKGLSGGVLSVKVSYVDGTMSVQWSQVARLESNQLFLVHTESGAVYTGKVSTTGASSDPPISIEIAEAPTKEVEVAQRNIIKLSETSEGFWRRFDGSVNTGLLYSKGNESVQYNVGSQVAYNRERWSSQLNFNSSFASSNGAGLTTRNQTDLSMLRAFALEQLVLYWYGVFSTKLGAGDQSANDTRRRDWTLLKKYQPGEYLRDRGTRLAKCCLRPKCR